MSSELCPVGQLVVQSTWSTATGRGVRIPTDCNQRPQFDWFRCNVMRETVPTGGATYPASARSSLSGRQIFLKIARHGLNRGFSLCVQGGFPGGQRWTILQIGKKW